MAGHGSLSLQQEAYLTFDESQAHLFRSSAKHDELKTT
jgi:hypothetical protein